MILKTNKEIQTIIKNKTLGICVMIYHYYAELKNNEETKQIQQDMLHWAAQEISSLSLSIHTVTSVLKVKSDLE